MMGVHEKTVTEISKQVAEQTEAKILEQLNFLVSRGILVVKRGQMALVQDPLERHTNTIRVAQEIELVSKEHEYIESLEAKIEMLEGLFQKFKQAATDVNKVTI